MFYIRSLSNAMVISPPVVVGESKYIFTSTWTTPLSAGSDIGVYGRVIGVPVTGSLIFNSRCCPTGSPKACSGVSRLNENILLSQDTVVLLTNFDVAHKRGFKSVSDGLDVSVDGGTGSARMRREDSESDPTWYFGIIAFALSLSGVAVRCAFFPTRVSGDYTDSNKLICGIQSSGSGDARSTTWMAF